MTAAMEAASTVESAACTAVEPSTAVKAAAHTAAECRAVIALEAMISESTSAESATAVKPVMETVVKAPAVKAVAKEASTMESMEPRAHADKHAVHEVIRAPIAVRRAVIRVIIVIPVTANRRRPIITVITSIIRAVVRTHPHSNLCIRVGGGKKQNPKQCSVL